MRSPIVERISAPIFQFVIILTAILPQRFNASLTSIAINEIQQTIERKHAVLARQHYQLPSAEGLHALLSVIGLNRLSSLVSRHTAPSHAGRSGTPDLFLYAIKQVTGMPCMHRFVEVKKPSEKVSDDQRAEIKFLRDLGLEARVLRLIERN